METFIGTITLFGFNFAPQGWAKCEGQLLPIAQNSALFSLLGTIYGGDGRTTFALPDLRGRAPIGENQGAGLTNRPLGSRGGTETDTLTTAQLPAHTHGLRASAAAGNSNVPTGKVLADPGRGVNAYTDAATDTDMKADAIGSAGGGQSVNNMPPYLAMNYCIALVGIFPSRN